ncbi:DUF418 domain-containing protein [Nocardia bhagyanarayanae]|uniref:DUF418 domain-containing protein n=1 Tax=Nocardia bhagyanarayanae TaxID=1215925 RepID=A0A543FHA3_9NOCA|nr:DUF418 domain-containing protein [Nocardia bhagyanarayanae]TQM33156.1 uncharacterized protein FB390_4873 [Nocardia bhagyanarayanae]
MSGATESVLPAATTGRRIAELDILRGFALFGILITNATVATVLWSFDGTRDQPREHYQGTVDHLVTGVVDALFAGRFYLLFAFLFGYSFTLQIAAAQRAGASANARLLRRCAALTAIGLAHVFLLWIGDILTLYAMLCLVLILLRKLRPRTALITGSVLYSLWCLWAFAPASGGDMYQELAKFIDLPAMREGYTGGFADTLDTQLSYAPLFLLLTFLAQGVTSLGLFLIGMAAGKRGLFEDGQTLDRWAPRVLAIGLGIGVPISAVTFAISVGRLHGPWWWVGVQELVNPVMTFAYIAGIVLLARAPRTERVIARLAPAGRMAASNYIGQSVVLMVLYTGYGFALADKVPPAGVIGLALLTYAAQLVLSAWWLRDHRYGPVEWLLRAVTYLRVPAWRNPEPVKEG